MRPAHATLALLCCVAACHPTPAPPPPSTPTPDAPAPALTNEPAPTDEPAPNDEPPPAELPDDKGWIASASVPGGSPCERSCAELHACVLAQDPGEPEASSSIELGCLEACVPNPTPDALFGCALPSSAQASGQPPRCAPFLTCVRDAWPEQRPDTTDEPAIVDLGSGCERACRAFARCEGEDQDEGDHKAIRQCIHECGEVLDDEQERRAGQCTELFDCSEIKRCVLALPGA